MLKHSTKLMFQWNRNYEFGKLQTEFEEASLFGLNVRQIIPETSSAVSRKTQCFWQIGPRHPCFWEINSDYSFSITYLIGSKWFNNKTQQNLNFGRELNFYQVDFKTGQLVDLAGITGAHFKLQTPNILSGSQLLFDLSAFRNRDRLRRLATLGPDRLHLSHNIGSLDNFPKNHVLPIKPRRHSCCNEKLTSIRIRTWIGHGE